jgi:hypothetical protein
MLRVRHRLRPLHVYLTSDKLSYVNFAILDFAGFRRGHPPERAYMLSRQHRYWRVLGLSGLASLPSRALPRAAARQLLPAGQPLALRCLGVAPGGAGSTGAPWQCARPRACGPLPSAGTSGSRGWAHSAGGKGCLNFPRNKKAAPPVRRKKLTLTINGLKKWVPDGTFSHELSRPKRVLWLPAYGTM